MVITPSRLTRPLAAAAALSFGLSAVPGLADGTAPADTGGLNAPEAELVERPSGADRGVFVAQIGTTNRADVNQRSSASFARVVQDGKSNAVSVTQEAGGSHYAAVAQAGDENMVSASQSGTGQTALFLAQQGNGNVANVSQADTGLSYSAAAIQQNGNGNQLTLLQDGSDNQARLTQDGNDNAMTALQLGDNNRLEWSQIGDGLPDLGVTQDGGSTIQITQSVTGAAFAPPPGSGG